MRNSAQHPPFQKIPIYILKGEMNILLAYLVPPPCTIVLLCPLQGIPGGCWENGGMSGPTNFLKGRRSGPAIELENKLPTMVKSCLHSGFTPRVRSVGICDSVKHYLDFSFVFSAPPWRNLFSASGIFYCGKYQLAYHYF